VHMNYVLYELIIWTSCNEQNLRPVYRNRPKRSSYMWLCII